MKTEPQIPETDSAWIPAGLSEAAVAILGIGLMGGSLAMALKGKTAALYGIDPDEAVCLQAQKLDLFDRVASQADDLLLSANFIVLCAPLGSLPSLIRSLPGLHPGHAVVMDIGSTKSGILPLLEELPARFAPLGGHPMCGREVNSLANASSDLYEGGSFALLPLKRTPQGALGLALQLVKAVGAHPAWINPLQHDRWVASISHLPYLVANCLAAVTPLDAAPLVGPGFKSTTRLAVESIEMMNHILMNNRENVLPVMKNYRLRLEQMEKALEKGDFDLLDRLFKEGAAQRAALMDVFQEGSGS